MPEIFHRHPPFFTSPRHIFLPLFLPLLPFPVLPPSPFPEREKKTRENHKRIRKNPQNQNVWWYFCVYLMCVYVCVCWRMCVCACVNLRTISYSNKYCNNDRKSMQFNWYYISYIFNKNSYNSGILRDKTIEINLFKSPKMKNKLTKFKIIKISLSYNCLVDSLIVIEIFIKV